MGATYRGARGLGEMLGAGVRALKRYTGTLFAVFVVQSLIAGACLVAVAVVLAQAFSHLPIFDEAVDGDLVAMIWILRHGGTTFLAVGGIVFGTILLWQLASWFLAGGIYGVLAQRPESRSDTAKCFGASGATTYLAYARLALYSLPGWALVLTVFGMCLGSVGTRIEYALTVPELVGALAFALVPALLLLHVLWTVTDYARVELTLRQETHDPSVFATYLRTFGFVLRRPLTLIHAGVGWILFLLVTLAYAYLAQGHPMYGAAGAVTLFIARQGISLLRMAIHVGVMAGQLELGRTRALPPRRVEAKVDAAS
ncbi:MAG: hypothetical protein JWP01_3670 [Myxococcales bacterium]|nr:hypothetical protein [Myxococcales bacterium]